MDQDIDSGYQRKMYGSTTSSAMRNENSLALDPIEKKPLRLFKLGSLVLSVGSHGCNLRCTFCQNHEISMVGHGQIMPKISEISPEVQR